MQAIWITVGLLVSQAIGIGLLLAVGAVFTIVFLGFSTLASFCTWLLSTWMLQTILAAWVALTFQKADATAQRKLDSLNKSYKRKIESTKAAIQLIDQRIYASRRYLTVIESEPSLIDIERESYIQSVASWNSEIKTHQISILVDFEPYYGLELDHVYFPAFQQIDSLLRSQRILVQSGGDFSRPSSAKIRSELSKLSLASLEMMRRMMKVAKADRDAFDRKATLEEKNLDSITYGQLLSALFALR
jgi:hypothetical protein